MVASRTTTTTTSTRGRRPHKARTFLTYSVPGGASRAAESISLRALRVATPRACAPAVDSVAHTPELVAQVFAVLRHDEVQQAKRATRCWLEVSRTIQTAARLLVASPYVATDPNHRTVHRFDAAGKLVRAERCADEAPNYLLCV